MKSGWFVYIAQGDTRPTQILVRECPDPPAARAMLEVELGTQVHWRESPR